jgi:hypothetical protein
MSFILFFGRYIYRLLRGYIVSAIIKDHNKDIKTGFHTCHILDLPHTKKNQPEGTLVDTVTRVKFKTFFCLVEKIFQKVELAQLLSFLQLVFILIPICCIHFNTSHPSTQPPVLYLLPISSIPFSLSCSHLETTKQK